MTGSMTKSQRPGGGIMEADDRQVTTVFTVQPSFHHRHSTNRVSWSVTIVGERRGEGCDCAFTDDGNASRYSVCWVPMVEWRLDCENCRHLTVVGLHDTGPRSALGLGLFCFFWVHSNIFGVLHSSSPSSAFPAIFLGFAILLLRSQLYFWGSLFFFCFFCFPS